MRIVILISFTLLLTSCNDRKPAKSTVSPFNQNINTKWKLVSPDPGTSCELWLSFMDDGRMDLNFKGNSHLGFYEIDSELNNYVRIKIIEKENWDQQCSVNPMYLSFYDEYTEFSWSRVDDHLYFQRSEKVIEFEKF